MLKFYVPHKSHDHSDFFMTMLGSWGITVAKQRVQQLVSIQKLLQFRTPKLNKKRML